MNSFLFSFTVMRAFDFRLSLRKDMCNAITMHEQPNPHPRRMYRRWNATKYPKKEKLKRNVSPVKAAVAATMQQGVMRYSPRTKGWGTTTKGILTIRMATEESHPQDKQHQVQRGEDGGRKTRLQPKH